MKPCLTAAQKKLPAALKAAIRKKNSNLVNSPSSTGEVINDLGLDDLILSKKA